MIWIMIFLSTFVCLFPMGLNLFFSPKVRQPKNAYAFNLFKEQLEYLYVELKQHRITQEIYTQRKVKIQKDFLKTAAVYPSNVSNLNAKIRRKLLIILFIFISFLSFALYLINGNPWLRPQPLEARLVEQRKLSAQLYPYLNELRNKLAVLPLNNPKRYQGYVLLGQLEVSRGNLPSAIIAWKQALLQTFDPELAAQTAEFQCQYEHRVSIESATLFREALKRSSHNAPWKEMAEQKLSEFNHDHNS
ncbi:hypothetical protein COMNV_01127 [Commensalibacter sp. Nvir]|nr:hypothetical protein COMNV_01127 [Commensalibacter sp. Nvir]